MLIDLNEHIPAHFHDQSRVWIYQCSRLFQISEALELDKMLSDFVAGWKSHADPVKGYANLFYGRFIVLIADETNIAVSGCSTDSSVALIRKMEQRFQVQLFDRQNLAFVRLDDILHNHRSQSRPALAFKGREAFVHHPAHHSRTHASAVVAHLNQYRSFVTHPDAPDQNGAPMVKRQDGRDSEVINHGGPTVELASELPFWRKCNTCAEAWNLSPSTSKTTGAVPVAGRNCRVTFTWPQPSWPGWSPTCRQMPGGPPGA